jgi:hypothetical protein
MLECTWDYTFLFLFCFISLHCIGFTCTCLTICKNSTIVALEKTLDDGQCGKSEDIFLFTGGLEGHIKTKYSLFLSNIFCIDNKYFTSIWFNVNNNFISCWELVYRHGSTSYSNFYTLIFTAHLLILFYLNFDWLSIIY